MVVQAISVQLYFLWFCKSYDWRNTNTYLFSTHTYMRSFSSLVAMCLFVQEKLHLQTANNCESVLKKLKIFPKKNASLWLKVTRPIGVFGAVFFAT